MNELIVTLGSDEHGFVLEGLFPLQDSLSDLPSNTLLEWFGDDASRPQLMVLTGSQWGPFEVTVRVSDHDGGPPEPGWEDIVELSAEARADLTVSEIVDGPVGALAIVAGVCRVRLSASGRTESGARDLAFSDDDVEGVPLEHYVVEIWPAPASPSILVREQRQYARDLICPPEPLWPAERDAGIAAAWALLRDLRGEPGARPLRGEVAELDLVMEVPGTPARMYNRVGRAFGWPTSMGGGGISDLTVGATNSHYASLPDYGGSGYGNIVTEIVETLKPRRIVKTWNWALPDPDGYTRRDSARLLARDSTVSIEFERADAGRAQPHTVITLRHVGVPAEWVNELRALWAWHVVAFASMP